MENSLDFIGNEMRRYKLKPKKCTNIRDYLASLQAKLERREGSD
jgi:uncharacterized protein YpiB (UPF0302 family)